MTASFCSLDASEGCVLTGVASLTALLSRILLLRSKGVRPRLFLISALFNQNSSMISVFLASVSSVGDPAGCVPSSALLMGVEVSPGTGWVLTGESDVMGDDGFWQGRDWEQMGDRGFPVRGQMER